MRILIAKLCAAVFAFISSVQACQPRHLFMRP